MRGERGKGKRPGRAESLEHLRCLIGAFVSQAAHESAKASLDMMYLFDVSKCDLSYGPLSDLSI